MFFHDIIGQENIKQRLIQSVKHNQIAHAQLFNGPEGCGKLAMALAYARYIQCTHRQEDDACGKCPSCVKYNNLMHPDLHFVFPIVKNEKKKKRICDDYLDIWRPFLKESPYVSLSQWLGTMGNENGQAIIYGEESSEIIRKLSLKTYESDFKVMIIWLPERMHIACANKLLKILEEPYENTVFLMISNQPDAILGTIQSRSQRINMRAIQPQPLTQALMQRNHLSEQDAKSVAHMSGGSYLKALECIHTNEEKERYFELFIQMMRLSYARKIKEMRRWTEEIADLGREHQKSFLSYAQHMIRENFILNIRIPQITYLNSRENDFSSRFAPFIHERNVLSIVDALGKAEHDIGQNANARIVFFDLSIKLIMLLKS